CLRAPPRADARAEVGPHRSGTGPQRAHAPDAVGGAAGGLPRPRRPHDQLLIFSISAESSGRRKLVRALSRQRPRIVIIPVIRSRNGADPAALITVFRMPSRRPCAGCPIVI